MIKFDHISDKKVRKALETYVELWRAARWRNQVEAIRLNGNTRRAGLPKHKQKLWDKKAIAANIRKFNAQSRYDEAIKKLGQLQMGIFLEEVDHVRI